MKSCQKCFKMILKWSKDVISSISYHEFSFSLPKRGKNSYYVIENPKLCFQKKRLYESCLFPQNYFFPFFNHFLNNLIKFYVSEYFFMFFVKVF